jgi:hypothetical protein
MLAAMDARPWPVEVGRCLARASERGLLEMIRRWQALPPSRRTHFLRKRVGFRMTAL